MAEWLTTLSNLVTLTFVVSSMLSVGLGLTLREIAQPLRNTRLVVMALLANFVVVPFAALVIARLIHLEVDHQIGLILLGITAGAPFLPKLAQVARTDLPLAVAVMALLIVSSVVITPIALAVLLPGIEVNAAFIALTLIVTILLPLAVGLWIKWRWEKTARRLARGFGVITNISLIALLVLMLGLNVSKVAALVGSGALAAMVIFTLVATATGYVSGGSARDTRRVLALGTGQRNLAACFTIASTYFGDRPAVLVLLAAAVVISMLVAMPLVFAFARSAAGSASG